MHRHFHVAPPHPKQMIGIGNADRAVPRNKMQRVLFFIGQVQVDPVRVGDVRPEKIGCTQQGGPGPGRHSPVKMIKVGMAQRG